jgi:cytochrome c-type biogenesis protein CcmF
MNASWGDYFLMGAVLTAAAMVLLCLAAVRQGSHPHLKWAKGLMVLFTGLITLACWALLSALLDSDLRVAYVASYTERALPTGYKVAAFWAGQEGSLLLWAWLLAVISMIAALRHRVALLKERAVTLLTLAIACGFFAALMLFAANPFKLLSVAPADGHGLNPLLQDPWMIAHPPLLFIGYAGFTVPFALLMGALAAKRSDNHWIAQTRPWLVVSWLFLGLGIVLGAKWAYVELGWGGYWAWDPVENASLLPWLTATALLHSILVQQQRGMFKRWNAILIAATFALCIFGTYLTRSGVISSVHAFGESLIGTFFLAFLVVTILVSAAVLIWRRRLLEAEQPMEHLLSKEGAFLATNVLLVLMTLITLVGTIFPLISGVVMQEPMSVDERFYNKAVVPMAVLTMALMACGPLMVFGKDGAARLLRGLRWPSTAAAAAGVLIVVLGQVEQWSLGSRLVMALIAAICAGAAVAIAVDLTALARNRQKVEDESLLAAIVQTIDANHRRYGGQVAHVGMLMIMLGVAGSSLFGVKNTFEIEPNQTIKVGNYDVTFSGVHEVRRENYGAVQAHVTLTGRDGQTAIVLPEMRFFDKSDQNYSQVALRSTLIEDVYVTLAGWKSDGRSVQRVALQVIINPLVAWIWIGGLVLTLGGVFGLVPRLATKSEATPAKRQTVALPLAGSISCPNSRGGN